MTPISIRSSAISSSSMPAGHRSRRNSREAARKQEAVLMPTGSLIAIALTLALSSAAVAQSTGNDTSPGAGGAVGAPGTEVNGGSGAGMSGSGATSTGSSATGTKP